MSTNFGIIQTENDECCIKDCTNKGTLQPMVSYPFYCCDNLPPIICPVGILICEECSKRMLPKIFIGGPHSYNVVGVAMQMKHLIDISKATVEFVINTKEGLLDFLEGKAKAAGPLGYEEIISDLLQTESSAPSDKLH